jgi:hypothetical protein
MEMGRFETYPRTGRLQTYPTRTGRLQTYPTNRQVAPSFGERATPRTDRLETCPTNRQVTNLPHTNRQVRNLPHVVLWQFRKTLIPPGARGRAAARRAPGSGTRAGYGASDRPLPVRLPENVMYACQSPGLPQRSSPGHPT